MARKPSCPSCGRREKDMILAKLTLAACLALGMAAAFGTDVSPVPLSVQPNPVPAGRAFGLYLLGLPNGSCTAYSRESVTVTGNRIDLRYTTASIVVVPVTDSASPIRAAGVVCPVLDNPGTGTDAIPLMAPSFELPALKAGTYEVWATNVPACRYSQPSCMIAETAVSAGTL